METRVRAGVALERSVLRYAEVEQYGARYRLLRLGSCRFDFDVTRALLHTQNGKAEAPVAEALADVLSGTAASALHVVLPAAEVCSFFAPLDPALREAERREWLQQEAALLAHSGEALHLTTEAAFAEAPSGQAEALDWVHVLALPRQAHARFQRTLAALPAEAHRWHVSTQGAARVAQRLAAQQQQASADSTAPATVLAIGWYAGRVEYTLCRGPEWRFSRCDAEGAPADAAYFALALLDRLGTAPSEVSHVFVYGEALTAAHLDPLQTVFGTAPALLNPTRLIDLDPESLAEEFDTSVYAPCLGVLF